MRTNTYKKDLVTHTSLKRKDKTMDKVFNLFLALEGEKLILPFASFGVVVTWNGKKKFTMRSMHSGQVMDMLVERIVRDECDAIEIIESWVEECFSNYIKTSRLP